LIRGADSLARQGRRSRRFGAGASKAAFPRWSVGTILPGGGGGMNDLILYTTEDGRSQQLFPSVEGA